MWAVVAPPRSITHPLHRCLFSPVSSLSSSSIPPHHCAAFLLSLLSSLQQEHFCSVYSPKHRLPNKVKPSLSAPGSTLHAFTPNMEVLLLPTWPRRVVYGGRCWTSSWWTSTWLLCLSSKVCLVSTHMRTFHATCVTAHHMCSAETQVYRALKGSCCAFLIFCHIYALTVRDASIKHGQNFKWCHLWPNAQASHCSKDFDSDSFF